MGPRQPQHFLIINLVFVLTTSMTYAQNTENRVLPDAPLPQTFGTPTPTNRDGSVEPGVSTEPKQLRPSFATSLTVRQKYALAYHKIVSPQMLLKATFVSGFELAAGTGPDLATNGWGAFGKRVGYNALGVSITTFFNTGFVPALAHQDPRYFALGDGPAKARLLWAVKSEFVGVADDGHSMPNYANLVGFALASIVANAYSPRSSVGYENTVKAYAIKIGVSTGMNVAREFKVFDHVKAIAHHSKSADE